MCSDLLTKRVATMTLVCMHQGRKIGSLQMLLEGLVVASSGNRRCRMNACIVSERG